MGQQMIYRPDGPGTSKGLITWATWTYNSKQLINPMPVFVGSGLSYEGLIPARQRDTVSVGWIYGKVSKFIPNTSAEQMIEVTYQWRHSRYMVVTPQFQYIRKPGGRNLSGAAVGGIQLALTF
jgi:carbohydrate-selective porin OprB